MEEYVNTFKSKETSYYGAANKNIYKTIEKVNVTN